MKFCNGSLRLLGFWWCLNLPPLNQNCHDNQLFGERVLVDYRLSVLGSDLSVAIFLYRVPMSTVVDFGNPFRQKQLVQLVTVSWRTVLEQCPVLSTIHQ